MCQVHVQECNTKPRTSECGVFVNNNLTVVIGKESTRITAGEHAHRDCHNTQTEEKCPYNCNPVVMDHASSRNHTHTPVRLLRHGSETTWEVSNISVIITPPAIVCAGVQLRDAQDHGKLARRRAMLTRHRQSLGQF